MKTRSSMVGIVVFSLLVGGLLAFSDPLGLRAASLCETIKAGGGSCGSSDTNDVVIAQGGTAESKIDEMVLQVINVILYVAGTVAGVMIIVGGIRYIISAGDEDMMTGAKKTITWAAFGLLMTILSWAIVFNVVRIGTIESRLDASQNPITACVIGEGTLGDLLDCLTGGLL